MEREKVYETEEEEEEEDEEEEIEEILVNFNDKAEIKEELKSFERPTITLTADNMAENNRYQSEKNGYLFFFLN